MSGTKRVMFGATAFVLAVVFWWLGARSITSATISGDAVENITIAYNLYHNFTYSCAADGSPTGYRQPGQPTYLALAIAMDPVLRKASLEGLLTDAATIMRLKRTQVPLLPATALVAMLLAWMLTRNGPLAMVAMVLVGLSGVLHWAVGLLLTELLSSMLVLCLSVSLCFLIRRLSYTSFALAGLTLSLLILTNAVFLYAIGVAGLCLLYAALRSGDARRAMVTGAILFVVTSSVLPLAWMTRNHFNCGRFAISGRGGIVLLTRANYNMMNATEYMGTFFWWTPGHYVRETLLQDVFGRDAVSPGGSLARINRDNESGYFRSAYAKQREIAEATGLAGFSFEMDRRLKRIAVAKIKEHPFRHLAAILPFAYRGSFVELGLLTPMALPYWLAAAFLLVQSFKKRHYEWLGLVLPAFYLIGIHSLMTHNLPRYNSPAVPILAVASAVAVQLLYRRVCGRPAVDPSVSVSGKGPSPRAEAS